MTREDTSQALSVMIPRGLECPPPLVGIFSKIRALSSRATLHCSLERWASTDIMGVRRKEQPSSNSRRIAYWVVLAERFGVALD